MLQDSETQEQPDTSQIQPQSRDACLDALALVLASQTFAKSARLSSFLRYVCTATLDGRGDALSEQHIGVAVFGRPEHFNPAEDTIVRTTARLLRQRLTQYYEAEGRADPMRIAIPRGGYVPVFVRSLPEEAAAAPPTVEAVTEAAPAPAAEPVPQPPHRRPRARLWLGGALAAVALVVAFVWFTAASPRPLDKLWSTLLSPDRDTLLVVADSGLVMYQHDNRRELSLDDYMSKRPASVDASADQSGNENLRGRRYTAMSSVLLALEMGKLAKNAAHRVHVRFARDVQLDDLKRTNIVIVGVTQSNPWWELYRNQLNFHIDWDKDSDRFLVRNDRPQAGEQALYTFFKDDPQRRGFATIAYARGLGGDGHALLVGGTTSAGTEAAIEFLLDPVRMEPLLKQASRPDGTIGSFEVLLQCVLRLDGNTDIHVLGIRAKPS